MVARGRGEALRTGARGAALRRCGAAHETSEGGAAWQTAWLDRHHRPAATAAAPASPCGGHGRRGAEACDRGRTRDARAPPGRGGGTLVGVRCAVAGGTKAGMHARTVALPPRLPGHVREEPWPHAYLSGHDRERHITSYYGEVVKKTGGYCWRTLSLYLSAP
jgi:hypothetical protein